MRTGMGMSFDFATKSKSASVIGEDSVLHDIYKNLWYKPFWDGDTLKVKEFRKSGNKIIHEREEVVNYVVGSGQHTNSHIYLSNNYAFQIPFTYYTQDGKFDFPPGFEDGNNSRFDRKVGLECLSCHNGFPDMVLGSENKYTHIPQGIDCERCHGPGEVHVKYKKQGIVIDTAKYIDYTIVNPVKLSTALQMDICTRCHLQGTMVLKPDKNFYDFKPGMPLEEVMEIFMPLFEGGKEDFIMASHFERFSQSKCYINSGKSFNCNNCHNPHISKKETPKIKYNNVCLDCHSEKNNYCTLSEEKRNKAKNSCVQCHVRESYSRDIPHVRIHDHKITIPPTPEQLKEPKIFKGLISVNNPKTDSLTMARGYLQEYETYHPDPDYLDTAFVYLNYTQKIDTQYKFNAEINYYFLKKNYNPIIKSVEKAGVQSILNDYLNKQDYSNYDAWTSYRIGQAYESAGNLLMAKFFYKNAITLATFNLEFQNKYGSLLTKTDKLSEAIRVFEFIISEYPRFVSAYTNLGYVMMRLQKKEKAKELFNMAIMLDPDNVQALINLAGLFYIENNELKTSRLIDRILKIEPDNRQALLLKSNL